MKVFGVIVERDGIVTRLVKEQYRFAADTIEQVWDHIEYLRDDLECVVLGIVEESATITVLG